MQAIIKTGGKQYRVSKGDTICIERLDESVGDQVVFDQVLMLREGDNTQLGMPVIEKAKVNAEVLEHGRWPKVNILKFKRRKHYMKSQGHRQHYTKVHITEIDN